MLLMIPHRLEQAQRRQPDDIRRVLRHLERHFDMALRAKIIDFVRLYLLDDPAQHGAIGQVAVVQDQGVPPVMRIVVQMIDPIRIEEAGAADQAVYFIAVF